MEELRDRFLRFCSFFVFKSLLLSVALSAYCLCEKMRAGREDSKELCGI